MIGEVADVGDDVGKLVMDEIDDRAVTDAIKGVAERAADDQPQPEAGQPSSVGDTRVEDEHNRHHNQRDHQKEVASLVEKAEGRARVFAAGDLEEGSKRGDELITFTEAQVGDDQVFRDLIEGDDRHDDQQQKQPFANHGIHNAPSGERLCVLIVAQQHSSGLQRLFWGVFALILEVAEEFFEYILEGVMGVNFGFLLIRKFDRR